MSLEQFLVDMRRDSDKERAIRGIYWQDRGVRVPIHMPINVDPVGLQEVERTMSSPVVVPTRHQPIGKTLGEILDQIGLAYVIRDGELLITAKESLDKPLDDESNP